LTIKRFAVLLAKNGLLLVGLVTVALVTALATMSVVLKSREVVVPSLLGKPIAEAGATAGARSLRWRVEGKRHDPKVPADRVVAQDPPPGSTLKSQRSVRVWLSLGPPRLNVPLVEGESLRTARITLEQALVPVGRVVQVNDNTEEGTVLMQHPTPGQGSSSEGVSLLVSHGPASADYLMPDLIGHRAEAVLDGLRRAGLKVAEVRYRSYPGVAPGVVLRQLPPAGHRVSARSSVSLDISKESP